METLIKPEDITEPVRIKEKEKLYQTAAYHAYQWQHSSSRRSIIHSDLSVALVVSSIMSTERSQVSGTCDRLAVSRPQRSYRWLDLVIGYQHHGHRALPGGWLW
ncbi:hypothetical protein RRG08_044007 [Elysia crispata]|uniref:Uncharacterized protein n=1 Tax=Elysia crispata TaxID=231223 RepID=A0AAE0Y1D6_9GAST|nr:hypothetical protein RRG08_044007 [Elysia crispata]